MYYEQEVLYPVDSEIGTYLYIENKKIGDDGILSTLDLIDFDTCVNCIKGKQTNKTKKDAKRHSDILGIIHTDICSPDMDSYVQKNFISFIDDNSF